MKKSKVQVLKQTQFRIDDDSDMDLLEAINNSQENFSKVTKLFWAEKLGIEYTPRKCGAKKNESD